MLDNILITVTRRCYVFPAKTTRIRCAWQRVSRNIRFYLLLFFTVQLSFSFSALPRHYIHCIVTRLRRIIFTNRLLVRTEYTIHFISNWNNIRNIICGWTTSVKSDLEYCMRLNADRFFLNSRFFNRTVIWFEVISNAEYNSSVKGREREKRQNGKITGSRGKCGWKIKICCQKSYRITAGQSRMNGKRHGAVFSEK